MLNYIIEVYFIRKVSSAVIRLQRSPPYTGCLPRNDHLLRRPPLYTGHLPMNRLFLTTATPHNNTATKARPNCNETHLSSRASLEKYLLLRTLSALYH